MGCLTVRIYRCLAIPYGYVQWAAHFFITRKRIAIMKKTNVRKLFTVLLICIALIVVIYYILYLYKA